MTQETITTLREEASARIESDPRGALSRFQHLVKIDPADIESWSNCANLLLRLGQTEAAADAFTHVLRLAERAKRPAWVSYAQRSLAQLGNIAPQHADRSPATPPGQRAAPSATAGGRSKDDTGAGGSAKPAAIATAIASASLACVVGIGFLLLVTAGAVSQLWHYPFVRAALLRHIDDLIVATLIGYIGSLILLKAWSRHRIGRVLIYLAAGVLLGGALLMTLKGLVPLGSIFAECSTIEDIKPACHIQIEEFEKMPPAKRKQLDVL